MIKLKEIEQITFKELERRYPFILSFFESNQIDVENNGHKTLNEYFAGFSEEEKEEWAIDPEQVKQAMEAYLNQMIVFLGLGQDQVEELTILPGKDKAGNKENFTQLRVKKSEIISIVGPTGAGKSRLLADIEWVADKDTPTERTILINGELPDKSIRYTAGKKLVAQLSQNMNFVMDLTVKEFLELHAKSRMVENAEEVIERIIQAANQLSGEKFNLDTPITSLSGGQSRALMIADTAILSTSPIVLIDEIENAGIDRKRALNLLVGEEKIVLMATHDPTLALMADRRIIINNGGISQVTETSPEEKTLLKELEKIDGILTGFRSDLRMGKKLTNKLDPT